MVVLTKDEAAMMEQLLAGLDDALSDYVPTPAKPLKANDQPKPTISPLSQRTSTPKANLMLANSPMRKQRIYQPTPIRTSKNKENQLTVLPKSKNVPAPKVRDVDLLLTGADDWDWADMEAEATAPPVVLSPPKKVGIKPIRIAYPTSLDPQRPSTYQAEPLSRCKVLSVTDTRSGNHQNEKHLLVRPYEDKSTKRLVILKDDWVLTKIKTDDIINVIGRFTVEPASTSTVTSSIVISASENALILHPDVLISATTISTTSQCDRKPIISSLLHSPVNGNEAMTWGNMLHEVMQECLSDGRWDRRYVEDRIDHAVRSSLDALVRINVGVEKAKEEIRTRAKGMEDFSKKYIADKPKIDAVLTDARGSSKIKTQLAVTGLHDIEEEMWSPRYGIKGIVDASLQATIQEGSRPGSSQTLPFEIKTGRAIAAVDHQAQTMLYTLLMSERYRSEIPAGLLYYTQSASLIRVKATRSDIRALLLARNAIATYMSRQRASLPQTISSADEDDEDSYWSTPNPLSLEMKSSDDHFLPPTIDQAFTCEKCYAVDGCMLYRKAVESVVDETSDISELYDLKTSHLTPSRATFFREWENLLTLEEQDMNRFRKELWTMAADEREHFGKCFARMVIEAYEDQAVSRARRNHVYRFRRATGSNTGSLLLGHIVVGDSVTITDEAAGLLAFARGTVTDLTPDIITAAFSKPIRVPNGGSRQVYRIDRDEIASGMSRVRLNLANLFYVNGDKKRLELVVDLAPPAFESESGLAMAGKGMDNELNPSQLAAMDKVLRARDYALILGMPGTGKSTTIANIVKELVRRGKTVLLTSYTHSAVDTILLKLLEADFDILRLGNEDKIHPLARRFTLGSKEVPSTLEQLEAQIFTPPVVATTCLSIDHALFSRRTFDYCIVDEASQVTLPTCLGPLRFADKFVLVGDHFQLPPLVRSRDARSGGLDVSLFRRLSEAHPEAVSDLVYQYRMNEEIMLLSNTLVYDNRLLCGNKDVANRSLHIPNMGWSAKLHSRRPCETDCWIERVIDEQCKVVFVDTDQAPGLESRVGDLVQNDVEVQLVHQLTQALLASGVRSSQIGVISPYRQQIKGLQHVLSESPEIDILTADRSQGRDKDCIIISMVRSNPDGRVGDLLTDWRRMNVSFTRARSKLVIFGSRSTLAGVDILRRLLELLEERSWILTLPPCALDLHNIASLSTLGPKRPLTTPQPGNSSTTPRKKAKLEAGILKGRPILKDLFNGAS